MTVSELFVVAGSNAVLPAYDKLMEYGESRAAESARVEHGREAAVGRNGGLLLVATE